MYFKSICVKLWSRNLFRVNEFKSTIKSTRFKPGFPEPHVHITSRYSSNLLAQKPQTDKWRAGDDGRRAWSCLIGLLLTPPTGVSENQIGGRPRLRRPSGSSANREVGSCSAHIQLFLGRDTEPWVALDEAPWVCECVEQAPHQCVC